MELRRAYRFFPALIALATFLTFLPALQNDWLNWDDTDNFVNNPSYRGLGLTQLKWMWSTQPEASWSDHFIPLSWMTLGLDYTLWGMNPFGYHLTNILLHTANSAVLYLLALMIFQITVPAAGALSVRLGALIAALLFAIHPLRVESVAWVTERRDVLSGLFFLLAILAYLIAYDPGRPVRRRYYWVCLACFTLAILSKEIAVTLPAVLLILDVYPLARLPLVPRRWMDPQVRLVWLDKIPFGILASALFVVMRNISRGKFQFDAMAGLGWYPRFAAPIYNLAFYLGKTLLPIHLSPFYPYAPQKLDPQGAPFEISLAVVLSITAVAILLWRRLPALGAVWAAYIAILSPMLGFIPSGPRLSNDRNTYLACIGWAILACAGFALWWNRSRLTRWAIPLCGAVVVLTLATLTRLQIPVWHDSEALWTQALEVEPSFMAYDNMADVLVKRGDDLWAAEYFRKAIEMRPDFTPAHLGLGGCLLKLDRPQEAAREYETVLQLGRDLAFAHNGLACALALEGKLDEAVDHFEQAIRLRPDYQDARKNLAQVVARKNSSNGTP